MSLSLFAWNTMQRIRYFVFLQDITIYRSAGCDEFFFYLLIALDCPR